MHKLKAGIAHRMKGKKNRQINNIVYKNIIQTNITQTLHKLTTLFTGGGMLPLNVACAAEVV
jgi:hypothetical protein